MGMTTTQIDVNRLDHDKRFTIYECSHQQELIDALDCPGVTMRNFKRFLERHHVNTDFLSLEHIEGKQAYILRWSINSFITFEMETT